jgi:hypothetical protein
MIDPGQRSTLMDIQSAIPKAYRASLDHPETMAQNETLALKAGQEIHNLITREALIEIRSA